MYHKLVSEHSGKISAQKGKQLVLEVIGDSLPAAETSSIVKAYQKRSLQESDFNNIDFFLDLGAYLYYRTMEMKRNQNGAVDKLQKSRLKKSVILDLLQRCGYLPAARQQLYDKNKVMYSSKNKFIRVHATDPADFIYRKLLGISPADINKAIGHNLLTVSSTNIPGTPLEIIERFINIDKVENYFNRHFGDYGKKVLNNNCYLENISDIYDCIEKNIFRDEFTKGIYGNNFGLVVRRDLFGNKRVYVVDCDFQIKSVTDFNKTQQLLAGIHNQCCSAQPNFLDYEKMIRYLPMLQDLEVQPILKDSFVPKPHQ